MGARAGGVVDAHVAVAARATVAARVEVDACHRWYAFPVVPLKVHGGGDLEAGEAGWAKGMKGEKEGVRERKREKDRERFEERVR